MKRIGDNGSVIVSKVNGQEKQKLRTSGFGVNITTQIAPLTGKSMKQFEMNL